MTVKALSFVELAVADLPAAVQWYRDSLGLAVELEDAGRGFVLLHAGAGRLALKHGRPEPGSVVLTFEVDDLADALGRLEARGVFPETPPGDSPEGYRSATVRDRDGYRLRLFQWLRPATAAEIG